jgi:hypothetical protein
MRPSSRTLVPLVCCLLAGVGCGSDAGDGEGEAALDPGSCSFDVSGAMVDAVATEARGITEFQGSSVLLFECAPDITVLAARLRVTVNGYSGAGSYTLDGTNARGQVQFTTTEGGEITNWPGAPSAACAVEVTSAIDGVAGTFSCTGLTDSIGQLAAIGNGEFEFHGVPPNMILIP